MSSRLTGVNPTICSVGSGKVLPHCRKMFAPAFDLDTETLAQTYETPSHNNAYADIRGFSEDKGVGGQQGSVYFGNPEQIEAVRWVLAAQEMYRAYPGFAAFARDIRMLRIENFNDRMPALALGS